MFRLEGVKKLDRPLVEWRGTANPGGGVSEAAHAAMRGLTRHFRAAFARKCSVCPRIAPKDQSGRHRSVATTVDFQEFGPTRFRFFHMFLTPLLPGKTTLYRRRSESRLAQPAPEPRLHARVA